MTGFRIILYPLLLATQADQTMIEIVVASNTIVIHTIDAPHLFLIDLFLIMPRNKQKWRICVDEVVHPSSTLIKYHNELIIADDCRVFTIPGYSGKG